MLYNTRSQPGTLMTYRIERERGGRLMSEGYTYKHVYIYIYAERERERVMADSCCTAEANTNFKAIFLILKINLKKLL